MRERITTILFLILAYCSSGNVYGQKVNYQQFDNIYLGAEASVISCFLQDSEGLIWVGSNKGLFSYDGIPHNSISRMENVLTHVSTAVL